MLPSVVVRLLILACGYVYPAYACFKVVQTKKPDTKELVLWCRYWIVVAVVTVAERLLDSVLFWLPMYMEAKLALFVYLWQSHNAGSDYVFTEWFAPLLCNHEAVIDANLNQLQSESAAAAQQLWRQMCMHAQVRLDEFFAYLSGLALSAQEQQQRWQQQQQQEQQQQPQQAREEDKELDEEGEEEYEVVEGATADVDDGGNAAAGASATGSAPRGWLFGWGGSLRRRAVGAAEAVAG